MDRAHASSVISRAESMCRTARAAQQLVDELSTPGAVTVPPRITVDVDASRADLFPREGVQWPANLYTRALFEGLNVVQQLRDFIGDCGGLIPLISTARPATEGFLGRLLQPVRHGEAQQAAWELMVRVDALDKGWKEAERYIQAAQESRAKQSAGVSLIPGEYGVGARFTDAARTALARELGLHEPTVETWDTEPLQAVFGVVSRYLRDANSEHNLRHEAEHQLSELTRQRAHILLEQMPLESLRTVTDHRLRFGELDTINVTTVADVLRVSTSVLCTAPGIGRQTATRMKAAALALEHEAISRHTINIGDTPVAAAVALVRIVSRFEQADDLTEVERARRDRIVDYCAGLSGSVGGPWLMLGSGVDGGRMAIDQITDDLAWVRANPNLFHPAVIVDPGDGVWQDYMRRPAHFQALLAALLRRDIEGTGGLHDAAVLERVRALSLNTSRLTDLHLRGYQSFGARFALVQKKVVLGDEMGLGKTVQALAVIAHLSAEGSESLRALVVCPASVLVNWVRECRRFTDLNVVVAHGDNKDGAVETWRSAGGILLCTYDGARVMDLGRCDVVIADEAHLLKNPSTQRTRALAELITAADHAVLMTGTPLENRVDEFVNLVRLVQPELITRGMSTMNAEAFRERVSPAYLRRNQIDVLDELPEKSDSIDWIELSDRDRTQYDDNVKASSWMGVRRSAMLRPANEVSTAKLNRVKELLDDARDAGHRALIFTFFRDVLDELEEVLGDLVVGRIDGSVSPTARQERVDALTHAAPGSALIAQITAGGVGLNIQAASLVILCEPQVTPTMEQQAIARVHRMGQTSTVQVHRLIGDDTADERMLELLSGKRQIFDVYARLSDTASAPDAVDVSETRLAAEVIALERARLGYDVEE